jgi:hypothetical protein
LSAPAAALVSRTTRPTTICLSPAGREYHILHTSRTLPGPSLQIFWRICISLQGLLKKKPSRDILMYLSRRGHCYIFRVSSGIPLRVNYV